MIPAIVFLAWHCLGYQRAVVRERPRQDLASLPWLQRGTECLQRHHLCGYHQRRRGTYRGEGGFPGYRLRGLAARVQWCPRANCNASRVHTPSGCTGRPCQCIPSCKTNLQQECMFVRYFGGQSRRTVLYEARQRCRLRRVAARAGPRRRVRVLTDARVADGRVVFWA